MAHDQPLGHSLDPGWIATKWFHRVGHPETFARADVAQGTYLSITHVGCSSGKAIKPMMPVAAISSGLFTFQRNNTASDTTPMRAVSQSPIAIFPRRMHAPRIVPIAAA